MALAQLQTYEFPQETLPTGDTVQLYVRFYNSDVTETLYAINYNMQVLSYGTLEWAYEIDRPLLVPGQLRLRIADPQNVLGDAFFVSPDSAEDVDPQAEIELKLNGSTEFFGRAIEEQIQWDVGQKIVELTAASSVDVVNKSMVYDLDDANVNPHSYTSSNYYSIITMLENIYKQVDSSIDYSGGTLDIVHGWSFRGELSVSPYTEQTFNFEDLYFIAEPFYFDNSIGVKTEGDLLRRMASDFGCFTGLIHGKRAFFVKLFHYDSGNTQTLGTVLKRRKNYKHSLIDFVRVSPLLYSGTQPVYDEGTETTFEDKILQIDALASFYYNYSGTSFTRVRAFISADQYDIWEAKDTNIADVWYDQGELLAKFWHQYRSNAPFCATETLTVSGIDYDYIKNFQYDGYNYQIIRLRKNYDAGMSELEAINLGPSS